MTSQEPSASAAWPAGSAGPDAGTMLREAREAAGLSVDVVSQHLKLAPRQVKALEDSEFDLLPGRTFVRGFARNYARLLHLDPDLILSALPGSTGNRGLESPALNPTTVTMGELPSSVKGRPASLRWLIVLVVLAIVVGAAVYAFVTGKIHSGAASAPPAAAPPPPPSVAPAAPAAPPVNAAPPPGTPLPNPAISAPLDSGESGQAAPGEVPAAPAAAPSAPKSSEAPSAIAPIVLSLRGPSWVEIRDGSGRSVLAQTLAAGQSPSIVGSPPFELVIGNAPEVTLTYRGQAVDLGPYTRQNVARLTLK